MALVPAFETVGSSAANHHSTIAGGMSYTTQEIDVARTVLSRGGSGFPPSMTPEMIALTIRIRDALPVPEQRQPATPKTQTLLADQKREVRRLLKRKVGKYSIETDQPHSYIHGELNRILGDSSGDATLPSLMRRVEIVGQWLRAKGIE